MPELNCIHCSFAVKLFVLHMVLLNMKYCLNRSIQPIDGTLTGNTIPSQRGTGSNGNIGFTLLYFKMAVIPLVPETKMVDVVKLMS